MKLGRSIDFLIDDKVLICVKALVIAKTQSWHSVCFKYVKELFIWGNRFCFPSLSRQS